MEKIYISSKNSLLKLEKNDTHIPYFSVAGTRYNLVDYNEGEGIAKLQLLQHYGQSSNILVLTIDMLRSLFIKEK